MSATVKQDEAKLLFCSFCGKSSQMVYIYCGENATICDECLNIVNQIKKMRDKNVTKFIGEIPKG